MDLVGVPGLMVVWWVLALVVWVAPLVAAVWIVLTLRRIRVEQQRIGTRLDAIERLLQHGRVGG